MALTFISLCVINVLKVDANVSFTGEFSPNPYLKNMISTCRKDFPWKEWPKFARFRKTKYQLPAFYYLVLVSSQKHRKILIFSYFHISTCAQIWLNHFQDDNHLSYITKLEKETLVHVPCTPSLTSLAPFACIIK